MSTRITNLTMSRGVLADVNRAQIALSRTQERLSSGKELTRPSDDPAAVGRALLLRTEMEGAQQLQRNVSEGTGWADVTDSALSTIADALHRARELAVQASTDTAGGQPRLVIAEELKGILDTVKAAANATYGGRYVLAGTATDAPPYAPGPDDTYNGDEEAISRQIGPGVTVPINVHGRQVIGDDTGGLLKRLRDVILHLQTNDGTALRADIGALDSSLDDLNSVRATVGATANRLEVAGSRLAQYEGTTLKLLSETEDADFAKTMIEFTVQKDALNAGLKAGAQIVQTSLLDFLR